MSCTYLGPHQVAQPEAHFRLWECLFQRGNHLELHKIVVGNFAKSNHKMTPALKIYYFCWDVQQPLLADLPQRVREMTVIFKRVSPSSCPCTISGEREQCVPLLAAPIARTIISQAQGVEIIADLEENNDFCMSSVKKKKYRSMIVFKAFF